MTICNTIHPCWATRMEVPVLRPGKNENWWEYFSLFVIYSYKDLKKRKIAFQSHQIIFLVLAGNHDTSRSYLLVKVLYKILGKRTAFQSHHHILGELWNLLKITTFLRALWGTSILMALIQYRFLYMYTFVVMYSSLPLCIHFS